MLSNRGGPRSAIGSHNPYGYPPPVAEVGPAGESNQSRARYLAPHHGGRTTFIGSSSAPLGMGHAFAFASISS